MDTKEEILQFLTENRDYIFNRFHISKIGLFGSFAKDEATKNSDVDIIFDFKKDNSILDIYTLKQELKSYLSSNLNRDVDLAREKYLKSYAKDEIIKSVIYLK